MSDSPDNAGRWQRFKRWFMTWQRGCFVPVPTAKWEWFLMRLLFAAVVFHGLQDLNPYKFDSIREPTGLARIFDLSFLANASVIDALRLAASIGLVVYVLGFFRVALLVSLPVVTICHILIRTFVNSQGFTHHGFQIVSLTLLGQTVFIWAVQIWEWRKGRPWVPPGKGLSLESYFVYYSQGIVLGTYVLAAIAKTVSSKGLWLVNARYISVDLVKAHRSAYYRDLDPALADLPPIALWMIAHPLVSTLAYGSGFVLELFALLALRNRVWALGFGVSLVLMHQMIYLIMNLRFAHNEALILIFLINVPFWIVWLCRGRPKSALGG